MEGRAIASLKSIGAIVVTTLAASTLLFYLLVHQVSSVWLDVVMSPEIRQALQQSLDDQKKLNELDPANEPRYRARFEATRSLLNGIEVVRLNREAMLRRFEVVLVITFVVALGVALLATWLRYRRARARERNEYADRLSAWQQASRRHAHEIRGPLTAARVEVERLVDLARSGAPADAIDGAATSIIEELDRLTVYTREFSGFGALAQPVLRREQLASILDEFVATFGQAWPRLAMERIGAADAAGCLDRDLVRQVLVNLAANSAQAVADAGHLHLAAGRDGRYAWIDVSDDGRGIAEGLRTRIFDPYVTTRNVGEGMGLGLAISRKIMLDHGGDLELVTSSPEGTTFRLLFRTEGCE